MTASAATVPIPSQSSPEPPPLLIERVLTRGRLTVAFRLLLALPQFIFLYVLTLVGSLVLIVGWFAALFLGRLPDGIADFLGQIVRYAVRVSAYVLLLTDRYPPFQFSAEVAAGILSSTVAGGTVSQTRALNDVAAAHDTLTNQGQKYQQDVAACSQQLACVQRADGELAAALETFATQVDGVDFPAAARDEGAAMVGAGHNFAGALRRLVAAPSAEEYTRLATGVDQASNSFDQRYQELVDELTR
jgi:hypothetical protein